MHDEPKRGLHENGRRGPSGPGRQGRRAAVLAVLLATAACSPYAELPPVTGGDRTADGELDSAINPTQDTDIGAALNYVVNYRETLVQKRGERTALRTGAGALVFGGAVATTAAALYGASTDLVLGLGLGMATTYVGSQLYNPRSYNSIYNAGLESIACIEEATRHVYASGRGVRSAQQALQDKVEVLHWRLGYLDTRAYSSAIEQAGRSLEVFKSARQELAANEKERFQALEDSFSKSLNFHRKLLSDMKEIRGNALGNLSAAENAMQEARIYRRQESEFAATAVAKVRSIGRQINEMIDEEQPSLDAVIAAAQGISASGIDAGDRTIPTEQPPEGDAGNEPNLDEGRAPQLSNVKNRTTRQSNNVRAALRRLSATPTNERRKPDRSPELVEPRTRAEAVDLARKSSGKVADHADDLLTARQSAGDAGKAEKVLKDCKRSTGEIGGGPIEVQPSGPIELAPGQTQSLLVSGGRQPYIPSWQGAKPDEISLHSVPRGANLAAIELTASDAVDRTYTLVISDTGDAVPVQIEVKSKGD